MVEGRRPCGKLEGHPYRACVKLMRRPVSQPIPGFVQPMQGFRKDTTAGAGSDRSPSTRPLYVSVVLPFGHLLTILSVIRPTPLKERVHQRVHQRDPSHPPKSRFVSDISHVYHLLSDVTYTQPLQPRHSPLTNSHTKFRQLLGPLQTFLARISSRTQSYQI